MTDYRLPITAAELVKEGIRVACIASAVLLAGIWVTEGVARTLLLSTAAALTLAGVLAAIVGDSLRRRSARAKTSALTGLRVTSRAFLVVAILGGVASFVALAVAWESSSSFWPRLVTVLFCIYAADTVARLGATIDRPRRGPVAATPSEGA